MTTQRIEGVHRKFRTGQPCRWQGIAEVRGTLVAWSVTIECGKSWPASGTLTTFMPPSESEVLELVSRRVAREIDELAA